MKGAWTLRELQANVRPWADRNFGADRPGWQPLLGVMEEAGELAHAHVKHVQGIRGITRERFLELAGDAVSDILTCLADYCSREGIDMMAAVEKGWGEVRERDWTENPGGVGYGEPQSAKACTGLTARWCPIHGICTCAADTDGDPESFDLENPHCSLHAPSSVHATAVEVAP